MVGTLTKKEESPLVIEREPQDESYGSTQIGPFDYCPKVGFREYWYPCVWAKQVGKKPVNIKMLGEDLVLFRGKKGQVVALNEWCPHRGARLSRGFCEFPGTVTCPYHGYTFDETGNCVAGLIETTKSPLINKMRTRSYPTAEWNNIVFVWMGETEAVPLEDDLPQEFKDPTLTGRRYTRVKTWETNWTEPMNQGIDYHEFYLHRGLSIWRLLDWRFPFWRPKAVSAGGTEIVSEEQDNIWVKTGNAKFGQADYPGLGKWPRKVWWRILPAPKTPNAGMIATATGEKAWATYNHNLQLPSKIRVCIGTLVHLRWGVPTDEENTRVWTFTVCKKPKTIFGKFWMDVWYYLWNKPARIVAINEKEDLVVFKTEHINLERSQKLGLLDRGLILFRRNLAKRSRDFQRLGGARGCLKQPPSSDRA